MEKSETRLAFEASENVGVQADKCMEEGKLLLSDAVCKFLTAKQLYEQADMPFHLKLATVAHKLALEAFKEAIY